MVFIFKSPNYLEMKIFLKKMSNDKHIHVITTYIRNQKISKRILHFLSLFFIFIFIIYYYYIGGLRVFHMNFFNEKNEQVHFYS